MLHDAFLFLAAGIACAAFGLIYEIFSHEVYSFYMIYAFLILDYFDQDSSSNRPFSQMKNV